MTTEYDKEFATRLRLIPLDEARDFTKWMPRLIPPVPVSKMLLIFW